MRHLRGDREKDVAQAAALLRAGELVAFPTETVYGLGANGLDESAVRRVFAVKGRPSDNPVILHVSCLADALPLWTLTPALRAQVDACATAFWPGPLTLVLPAAENIPRVVTAGLGSVGVRVPRHPVALALLESAGVPVAAPSANRSGRPSPTTAQHVILTLDEGVAAVLDGGATDVGLESTVLDLSRATPTILRPGMIEAEAIVRVLGRVELARASEPGASPGLRHRHYAPAVKDVKLLDDTAREAAWRSSSALLLLEDTAALLERTLGERAAPVETLPRVPAEYARGFYAALYRLERLGAESLLVEDVPDQDGWRAVRDRVHRAAGATS